MSTCIYCHTEVDWNAVLDTDERRFACDLADRHGTPALRAGASVPPADAPQPPALPGRAWRAKPPTVKIAPARVPQAHTGIFDIVLPRGPYAGQVLATARFVDELRALWKQFPMVQTLAVRNRKTGFRFTASTSYALPAEEIDYLVDGLPTPDVIVYADGACSGNPGPAAYAAVLVQGQPDAVTCRELAKALHANPIAKANGHAARVIAASIGNYGSNNVAELHAVLAGLGYVTKAGANVLVRTDSQNVVGWLSLGWKRKCPAIADLAGQIDALIAQKAFVVAFEHVKGHAGDPFNELADRKAQAAIQR